MSCNYRPEDDNTWGITFMLIALIFMVSMQSCGDKDKQDHLHEDILRLERKIDALSQERKQPHAQTDKEGK